MKPSPKRLLCLVGPTASGKTEVAYEISKLMPVEVVSCDSMQVYRGMSVTTQAPGKRITRRVKTHLISFKKPTEEYNAAQFRRDALRHIRGILKRGRVPLIVGGTGLYLRALLDGLFEAENNRPLKDESLREKLLREAERHGKVFLHRELQAVDPAAARKIHPNDLRRVVRALEVFRLTGKPFSQQLKARRGIRKDFDLKVYLLEWDRAELYTRIDRRVERMMRQGWIREVRGFSGKRLSKTAGRALGVPEGIAYLQGERDLKGTAELLKRKTRNYAKRQLSWFRQERGIERVAAGEKVPAKSIARAIVRRWKAAGDPGSGRAAG